MSMIIDGTNGLTFNDSTTQTKAGLVAGGTIATGTITTATVSTLNAPSGVLATQNGMTGIPKSWVQFSMSGTTITINGSFNVSSITLNSTGFYTYNFATNMPSINYSAIGNCSVNQSSNNWPFIAIFTQNSSPYYAAPTVSSFGFSSQLLNTGGQNIFYGCLAVFSS